MASRIVRTNTSPTITRLFVIFLSLLSFVRGEVFQLTSANFEPTIAQYELVFINFYADWCRFSQILAPVFKEASEAIAKEYTEPNKVLFAKLDCDAESALAARFHITKYPTLKVVRNGQMMKKEFRGQRSVEGLSNHIRELLKDPMIAVADMGSLFSAVAEKKAALIGVFAQNMSASFEVYRRVAADLKDDCNFYGVIREPSEGEAKDRVFFKNARTGYKPGGNAEFEGSVTNFDALKRWAQELCIPLVREITFENAEELTEEGLPFLILFHNPDDKKSVDEYTQVVSKELLGEKSSINFLIADGVQFSHPLMHLGKTVKDLPVIAIDSFRHMYVFPNFNDIHTPGKLLQFIKDLHSGKLHREFHYGPDPTQPDVEVTTPPESAFKKLAPSSNRYTVLKDEL